jgi:hypothetical protein
MSTGSITKGYEKIKLQKTDHAKEAMELMDISDEQVKMVIDHGEKTGDKLYQQEEERFLAKMRIEEATICVEYSPMKEKDTFKVHTAYAYKGKLKV